MWPQVGYFDTLFYITLSSGCGVNRPQCYAPSAVLKLRMKSPQRKLTNSKMREREKKQIKQIKWVFLYQWVKPVKANANNKVICYRAEYKGNLTLHSDTRLTVLPSKSRFCH